MIAMVVDILRRVGVATFAEVGLAGFQRQPGDAAGAGHLESPALDRVEEEIVVMVVRFNALAGLERELSDANALVLENQLGSDFGHTGFPPEGGKNYRESDPKFAYY